MVGVEMNRWYELFLLPNASVQLVWSIMMVSNVSDNSAMGNTKKLHYVTTNNLLTSLQ